MIKIPELNDEARADFLTGIKFPEYAKFQRPILERLRDDPDKFLEEKEVYQEIEAYRESLLALPQAELRERYKQEKAKLDLKRENAMFFNQPNADADFDYWSKMAHWSLDEAIALSFGKNPEVVMWKRFEGNYEHLYSSFGKEYSKLHELASRALKWQKLYDPVMPQIFIKWAKDNDIAVPKELAEKVEARNGHVVDWKKMYDELLEKNNNNVTTANQIIEDKNKQIQTLENVKVKVKPMHTKEKETLLKLVIGMAIDAYGYNPDANRSPIPKEIANILAEKDMPIDPDTVRKWLREAAQLLPQSIEKAET